MMQAATQTSLSERYAVGLSNLNAALLYAERSALKPPPKLSLSEWSDRYAYLSVETSAKGGKFTAFPYQNGIMDAITDPSVKQVSVIKSARVGYTRLLDNAVGYFIHQDPAPVLVVQPRVEDAEDYSRSEIAPMLRDTPVLTDIAGDLKAKDSNQRVAKRMFRNGASVSFVGANSPGGFRRITARVILFDEVDGYPTEGAGNEGDQIALGTKRSESFWNRKIVLGSTPTIKGLSRIEKAWDESDQRQYFVPCPHCGHKQTIRWDNIHWNKDLDDKGKTVAHHPETAYLVCEAAGCIIEEHHKPAMLDAGEWIAAKPFAGHAGFRIWAGYSLFTNAAWSELVKEWLRVHRDPFTRKTFTNLVLGETWDEDTEKVDGESLMARLEDWGGDAPNKVRLVTVGVDVQPDRLELERIGWGDYEENWSLDYRVIPGDTEGQDVWRRLDEYLLTRTRLQDGTELPVKVTCVDSGYASQTVYKFTKPRKARLVYAIKGVEGKGLVWQQSRSKKSSAHLHLVHVDVAKDAVYSRLRSVKEHGPGFCHFPVGRDKEYFEQLTSEVVRVNYVRGRPVRGYRPLPNRRTEALDCRVYAYAALQSLGVLRWETMARVAPQRQAQPSRVDPDVPVNPSAPPMPPPVAAPVARGRTVRRSSWM